MTTYLVERAACASLIVCVGCASVPSTPGTSGPRPLTPRAEAGGDCWRDRFSSGGLEFDAIIQRPAQRRRNNWGVLLVGGGMGNDLDWSVPGSINVNGSAVRLTMSGQPHADAPVLSQALIDRGFTVMRWSTIAIGDPLAGEWPVRATPRSLTELTDQARAAIGALKRVSGIKPDRIMLVGHSLGAARACTIAVEESGVCALVLLAPAYFTREAGFPASFSKAPMRFGEDVLRERALPCLALFGSADTSKVVDARRAAALAGKPGLEKLEVRVFEGLGHQLGPVSGGLVGPISGEVVECVATWAAERAVQR